MIYNLFEITDDQIYILIQSSNTLSDISNKYLLMKNRYPLNNFIILKKVDFYIYR